MVPRGPAPTLRTTTSSPTTDQDRPSAPATATASWRVALVVVGALALAMAVFVLAYPDDGTGGEQPARDEARIPRIIERPEDGRAPAASTDPGGWQQLAVLGLVLVGLAAVALLVWRSSRRARARQKISDNSLPPARASG